MTEAQPNNESSSLAAMTTTSVLASLLSHCRQNLHGNGLLSLRQLVPVHQTLCQCMISVEEGIAHQDLSEKLPGSIDAIIRIRCGSSTDRELCQNILTPNQSGEGEELDLPKKDPECLLVLQFLVFPLSLQDSLRFVLIPYVLSEESSTFNTISDDLELALLDLMGIPSLLLEDTPVWRNILAALVASPNPSSARMLVRLVARQPDDPLLIQALYDKLWQTVLAAMASPPVTSSIHPSTTFQNHPILSTLSKDLLPLLTHPQQGQLPAEEGDAEHVPAVALTTESHRPHIQRLWSRLFEELWYKKSPPADTRSNPSRSSKNQNENRVAMLVITTVLCPILPYLEHRDMPLVLADTAANQVTSLACPVQQPALWNLIYWCLSQGTSALEEDGMAALSSILRRRGLFLMNTIVTTNEWKQYVVCYETLEMESEQHLVDQIWEYVGDLFDRVVDDDNNKGDSYGVLTWGWMSLLFGCVLSATLPVVRKMGMHRILKAHELSAAASETANAVSKKSKRKQKNKSLKTSVESILDRMPPDFMLRIFLPSWNSLAKTVGYTMHIELENRRLEREDMIPMMKRVLHSYIEGLDAARAEAFWSGLWDWSLQQHFATRTFVMIFHSLAEKLASSTSPLEIPAGDSDLKSLTHMLQSFFAGNSVVVNERREILEDAAIMLAHSRPLEGNKWNAITILRLLTLYKQDYFEVESEDWSIQNEPMLMNLKTLVARLEQNSSDISSTLASAFVDGQLGLSNSRAWDPENGSNSNEREMGWAILLFASLAADTSIRLTTGQLIWPAINKGLSNTAGAIMTSSYIKADHVTRALLLLESGCLMRQLSGLGNGDLVVLDRNTQQLMPPPASIESMLSRAVDFCLFHIRTLLSIEANEGTNGSRQTSITYAHLVSQLRTLHQSYPSSQVISTAMETLIKFSSEALINGGCNDSHRVMHVTLIYAALSSGADLGKESYIPISRSIVALQIHGDTRNRSNTWEHMARSILFYAKWASMSVILPMLGKAMEDASASESYRKEAHDFIEWLLSQAFDSVSAAALDAVVPVFNCILEAAKLWINGANYGGKKVEAFYVDTLEKIVMNLIELMQEATLSFEGVYMLNRLCSLIFLPRLMQEEYERFNEDPESRTPIRDGFRKLIQLAGSERAHISRSVLCKVAVGWLGPDEDDRSSIGLNAIPYRDDIVDLLVHKEIRKEEAASNQNRSQKTGGMEIPTETNELSLTRAFVLVFFEKLPDLDQGLNVTLLKELIEPVILGLLIKAEPIKSTKPSLIMKGTPTYCIKMRAWQALCNLSRFVTSDIVEQVCNATYTCIQEAIHSQIRYFVEVFAVKCGIIHPDVFGDAFLKQIVRTDLTLQQVASLMIIGGNWIVGRYKLDYFKPDGGSNNLRLRKVLAGAIPWLSSTQGFSRAIAQLLVYAMVPLVIDVSNLKNDSYSIDDDSVLRLIYNFLEENREMARLRRKQTKFFEAYQVESVCTPKGVLGIAVDEGDEADPAHLVDVMKQTLINVYEETHGLDAPDWKQMEAIVEAQSTGGTAASSPKHSNGAVANFQRKIMPLDALNLAMESQREIKRRNAAGERKQQLVVCASLIDKVPNLAGLARTAEIFAADRLIIPDKSVCVMDNFQSISVGAGDWIEIEQVRPEVLLPWLLEQKAKGYFIFGLEQTASSVSLDSMVFPNKPTILLLGKEKEGIPVELLQAVDQCVEIPQLGIIRSLNVHVSGAIAIWEHTKQQRLRKDPK